jgi:Fe-S cluster assembly protein SufD
MTSPPPQAYQEREVSVLGGGVAAGTDLPGERLSGPGVVVRDARAQQVASYDPADFPVPGGREELWRFTPLDRLRGLFDGEPSESHLEWKTEVPEGVELTTIGPADPRVREVPAPIDRLAALAVARCDGAALLRIPAEAELDRPVFLRLRGASADDLVWGHLVLEVGAFAKATVVVDHEGSARYDGNISVLLGDGAALTLVSVQDWDGDAVHTGHHVARIGRDARYRHVAVTLGGDLVRLFTRVSYDGPGGDAQLLGLYFADAGQHLEHRLLVEHGAPHCRSRVTYKGALQGADAHTVWVGDVVIRHAAVGTDTYELNRNLVLTEGARADSVPNLEIETGEVAGAGHASATGRFDDEQLFYLQSRGIPSDVARRLVVRGFFADVIDQIGVPELTERLTVAIDAELAQVGG